MFHVELATKILVLINKNDDNYIPFYDYINKCYQYNN